MLVDGMALLFRGYFATAYTKQFMINDKGIPTNGVYQFLRYFLDGIHTFNPSHVIVCWDMGSKTFRTEKYPNYKANRDAPPKELIPQFDLAKEAVELFSIPNIGIQNYEADDVIGSLAKEFNEHEVIIQTGDLDLLQLVEENVQVAIMRKGLGNYEVFNSFNFLEKKGIKASQIVEFKGMTGDNADNYPGIKGVGEKTALKLLQTYDTMDNVLINLKDLTPGLRNKIEQDLDNFYMSKDLAKIKTDLTLTVDLESAKWHFDEDVFREASTKLGLRPMNLNFIKTLN